MARNEYFDAAVLGDGKRFGKAYFFKGNQYIRYDFNTLRTDDGYPRPINPTFGFPGAFARGIDAAVNGAGELAGKAAFFKGDRYIRYDFNTLRVDEGYPKKISHWFPTFPLSVASGDPTPHGVVLWTRVDPLRYDAKTSLEYEVSPDKRFKSSKKIGGKIPASDFSHERDYTVNLDLEEQGQKLLPNTTYYYRFKYKGDVSSTGRCRTLPTPDENLEKLRLAVVTCNDYSMGYFNAFYHLAEEDVDFVIHLGDFVYEYPQYPPGYGTIRRTDLELKNNPYSLKKLERRVQEGKLTKDEIHGGERATTLENFRQIYRTYREDYALQAAMERHTWIITLDDHELADDAYFDYENKTLGAHPDHFIYKWCKAEGKEQDAHDKMRQLARDAMQAWREYVPARVDSVRKSAKYPLAHHKIYRDFRFGSLVDFFLTDSRTYRDKPSEENKKINEELLERVKQLRESDPNKNVSTLMATARQQMGLKDWQLSMLGPKQKKWLIKGLTKGLTRGSTEPKARWQVWGNQTLLSTAGGWIFADQLTLDDWSGFMAERYEILQAVKDSHKDKEKSYFVVFTGDLHTSLIAYLKTEFEGLGNKFNIGSSTVAGVEFMTPAVTSAGLSESIRRKVPDKISGAADEVLSYVPGAQTVAQVAGVPVHIASWFARQAATAAAMAGDAVTGGFVSGTVDTLSHEAHKALVGSALKKINPHIEHFDSAVNGYAVAEFTRQGLTWTVYDVFKSRYDELGSRKVSKKGAPKSVAQTATYDPERIKIRD